LGSRLVPQPLPHSGQRARVGALRVKATPTVRR
jgi:hypothetical protein